MQPQTVAHMANFFHHYRGRSVAPCSLTLCDNLMSKDRDPNPPLEANDRLNQLPNANEEHLN